MVRWCIVVGFLVGIIVGHFFAPKLKPSGKPLPAAATASRWGPSPR